MLLLLQLCHFHHNYMKPCVYFFLSPFSVISLFCYECWCFFFQFCHIQFPPIRRLFPVMWPPPTLEGEGYRAFFSFRSAAYARLKGHNTILKQNCPFIFMHYIPYLVLRHLWLVSVTVIDRRPRVCRPFLHILLSWAPVLGCLWCELAIFWWWGVFFSAVLPSIFVL